MANDLDHPVGHFESGLDRVVDPGPIGWPDHQAVDHHRDLMILAPVEFGNGGEVVGFAVDANPHEAPLGEILEEIAKLALPAPNDRTEDFDPGSLRPGRYGLGDLRRARAGHRRTIVGTVRRPGAGPEEPHIVVDLGDGPDRGPRVVSGGLLLNGDRRRETFDRVDIGFFHESEELAGIGRQRLDVPPLALGVDGIEGE